MCKLVRSLRTGKRQGRFAAFVLVCSVGTAAWAGEPASLSIFPPKIQLDSAVDRQRIVVFATMPDGTTRDVTAEAQVSIDKPAHAKLEDRIVVPVADGTAALTAGFGGKTATADVIVKDATSRPPASLRLDVEPILMRAGCNQGTCHGSASGKNGFGLSLFGFDPDMDHRHLTRQTRGRRIDTANPDDSLMLKKASAAVAHEGGERFKHDSPDYEVIKRWIAEGAANDKPDVAELTGIELYPRQSVIAGKGGRQQLLVRGVYSDGTDRDVTRLAVLSTNNDRSATVDDVGVITARERGEAYIMVRYGTFAGVSQVIVLPEKLDFTWPDVTARNYIDTKIHDKLKKLRIAPSEVCSDQVFLRRVYLDIVGGLPTVAEYERFMADGSPDKRAKLIDELLKRPEFPEIWAMKWAEMLRIESKSRRISFKAMFQYNNWLRDAILGNMPLDKMVRTLLTASGGNFTNPAANFYMVESSPTLMAENVAQVFLGIRIQCAQCHNHPFERWKMDDYYSFAAFFQQVGRKRGEDPRETIVFNSGSGEVRHKANNRVMAPKFLGGPTPNVRGKDRRQALADWITSPDNPWFTTCFTNRVWAHFFGRGITDPVDDVRVSNPPSNPELLEALAGKFVEYKYDLRKLVRDICNSRTYQLATRANDTNAGDETNFARGPIRRLPAEQLLDAICQVTEVTEKFRGLPVGARAAQVADGKTGNFFLDVFGRPDRTSACTCDRRGEPTLGQALHLINGSTIDGKIKAKGGRIARLLNEKKTFDQIANELYAAALSRRPTPKEMEAARTCLGDGKDLRPAVEDLFWAVLNSREFVFNH